MLVVPMNALKWRDWGSCASIEFQRRGEEDFVFYFHVGVCKINYKNLESRVKANGYSSSIFFTMGDDLKRMELIYHLAISNDRWRGEQKARIINNLNGI